MLKIFVVIILVIIIGEWDPVICSVNVCVNWFYFTLLRLCCYWRFRTPSTWLGRFPVSRPFGCIFLEFPALSFGTVWMEFVAMLAFCCISTSLNPCLVFFCVVFGLGLARGCSRGRCCCFGLAYHVHELGYVVIVGFDKCFQLLGVSLGKIFNEFFCCCCVLLHHIVCWRVSCCSCRYSILAVGFCVFRAHEDFEVIPCLGCHRSCYPLPNCRFVTSGILERL